MVIAIRSTLDIQAHLADNHLTANAKFCCSLSELKGLKNPSTLFLHVDDSVNVTIHAVGALKVVSITR